MEKSKGKSVKQHVKASKSKPLMTTKRQTAAPKERLISNYLGRQQPM
jgi:hypothetical protein